MYGAGRIAQQQTTKQYFGADALGSVRQIYNSSGQIIANKRYDPYGNVLAQNGVGTSNYGYTGEWMDSTGLEYLRARYYTPSVGRFVTRDTWEGDYQRPLTLNGWNYVEANPTNNTDATGRCANGDTACLAKAQEIVDVFPNVKISLGVGPDWLTGCGGQWFSKHWKTEELQRVQTALRVTLRAFENDSKGFERAFGTITFARQWMNIADPLIEGDVWAQQSPLLAGWIIIFDSGAQNEGVVDAVIHEMGHVLDLREWRRGFGDPWSYDFVGATGGACNLQTTFKCFGGYHPGGETTQYGATERVEDFAESFRVWVYSKNRGEAISTIGGEVDQARRDYIQRVVNHYRNARQ